MKNIAVAIICLLGAGCVKEKQTSYIAMLYNNTSVDIQIFPFSNGITDSPNIIIIKSMDSFLIAEGWLKGEVKTPSFESKYFENAKDSTIILFNNKYNVSHYFIRPTNISLKHYFYEDSRNIYNRNNYEFTRIEDKNDNYTNVHKYFFTEQDYLDAKE